MKSKKNSFEALKDIARTSLRACYLNTSLVASPTYFSDYWARDSFWALGGMLVIGDHKRARDTITHFLSFQRTDGKIPRKISRDLNVIKYLFGKHIMRRHLRPTYYGLIRPFYAMDSELLMIIGVEKYLDETRDYDFTDQHYQSLHKAMTWHTGRTRDKLVHEYLLGNWMDTIFKNGPVLYTNVLYVQALEAMVTIAQVAGRDEDAQYWATRAHSTKGAVRTAFWNGLFFADEAFLPDVHTFDLAGNVLAVLSNVGDREMQNAIMTRIENLYNTYGAFMPASPIGYPWYKINPLTSLVGIRDYQTSTSWLWITILVARMFIENNRQELGEKILSELGQQLTVHGEIGETYFCDGQPYSKRAWRSATPFAWSSGVLLETLAAGGYIQNDVSYKKPEPRIC